MASTFDKYQKRGAYHWEQVNPKNIFRYNAFVKARYDQVVSLIPKKSKRILDVGCGDGVLLSLIGRKSQAILYGIDPDPVSLTAARQKVKAKFVLGKAEKLPFKNNLFDVVVATEIIEHLSHPAKLLAEARRVLKSGGRLIVTSPVKTDSGLTDPLHVREFSPAELKKLAAQYFEHVRVITSHPLWLKRFYCQHWGKVGRYYLDLGRWLVNLIVLITGWQLFTILPGRPSQQLVIGHK